MTPTGAWNLEKAESEARNGSSLGIIDGRFVLRELLGQGGFGKVYRAYDGRLDRNVALKVLKSDLADERVRARFFREARAVAALDHPNIVKVHDSSDTWVAYELIEGDTLDKRLREGRRPDVTTSARIVLALARALDHAHRRHVYHRDLKPANVVIDRKDNPRLIDFGLARRADCDSDLTREGAILGTPAYMSPEQRAGLSPLADGRSDIYSLGLIFYEMLSGQRALETPSCLPAWQKEGSSGSQPPEFASPRSIRPEVPVELDRICMKAMANHATARYDSARTMATELEAWLRSQSEVRVLPKTLTTLVIGALSAVVLIVGLVAIKGLLFKSAPEPPRALVAEVTPVGSGATVPFGEEPTTPAPPGEPTPTTVVMKSRSKTDRYHTSTECSSFKRIGVSFDMATLEEMLRKHPRLQECAECIRKRTVTPHHGTP